MARPKSDDRRNAILAAAVRVIVAQGLSAPTAAIAREAGISNGSLFTYFETKTELFNQLYLELKAGMATAALDGFSAKESLRDQFARVWSNWTHWATSNPDKRRALMLLQVSGDITPETRAASHKEMAFIAALLERARAKGPMKDTPMVLVSAIMTAVAETTMDFMLQHPDHADEHSKAGFDALWRMLS
ncbi:TetR/AcrR family transcriptional regulator [Sandaracinus amylolyticus]|uniref:Transcriptional regulator, TetR family protein n=1 Tax=Sandaracinus amylolyticus TaxID=927083 RepID=A0A0F6W1Z5_9BACT|nr:TetR/AcrR family transcriptional regulator [Sandaracinus amylolyticus]AKF05386.1 Transcriptional regulator, TetR family protein [Sandaracinus amylolyticus]